MPRFSPSDPPTRGVMEPEVSRRMAARPPSVLVEEAMVGVAQQNQVVQGGPTAVGPVDQVVGVQPPLPLTPGEPAGPFIPVP
jgi:hypothetical protein